ncbi:chromosome partitioning protein ParA [Paraburkholderia caballeronis]|uniref:Uncharacterized protein n=1 Tax=Paraburkholderia caballeronis TaxID=416943 RepID=A0A1H7L225_9BURK|nr:chromosome partitioning protein ParA [Paraburkholderia caballeronis]PXW28255.1 hypothetical protein C7403_102147 [Paraburkholderia caballeronis]PXX03621.1 hypothetical protein C7407_102147 [Paraburkholderia caballeronis]RAK04365.1 hypothetical protein C7409_102147 [Paraburkholderia caballeronis]SED83113.1 hypothetical protein SAMN05445871_4032 [Paraburkholderia caballeronis]SEK92874.1 hypothetical protein SAMN05192542_104147 [Paraburkholderia caballeronis]
MDFATPKVIEHGNQLHVQHGDDSRLYVEFEMRPVHLQFESEKEGRPIYKDLPYINIHFPGDRTKQICRPVKMTDDAYGPADPTRFPRQWAAFQAQKEQVQEGTPVEQWGPLTRSQAMELKGMRIHTVEQLSSLPDSALTWLGARELRDQAKSWLAQASGGREVVALRVELDKRDLEIADLKRQVQEIAAAQAAQGEKAVKSSAKQQAA